MTRIRKIVCLDCDSEMAETEFCPKCGSVRKMVRMDFPEEILPVRQYYINGKDDGEVLYEISIHNYDKDFFRVYANFEMEALYEVADFCTEKGWTGHFLDEDDLDMLDDEEVIEIGENSMKLNAEHLRIWRTSVSD